MKIIITEKQAEKLFGEKIKCKCGHSWVKEKEDKQPYLCHMCGKYSISSPYISTFAPIGPMGFR